MTPKGEKRIKRLSTTWAMLRNTAIYCVLEPFWNAYHMISHLSGSKWQNIAIYLCLEPFWAPTDSKDKPKMIIKSKDKGGAPPRKINIYEVLAPLAPASWPSREPGGPCLGPRWPLHGPTGGLRWPRWTRPWPRWAPSKAQVGMSQAQVGLSQAQVCPRPRWACPKPRWACPKARCHF